MNTNSKDSVAATFNAAADCFDALCFRDYFGGQSVLRARIRPGDIVLDVCSGTGSSAIPAAHAAAPGGRVIGLDLAPALIDLARTKAPANAEFRQADFDQAYFRHDSFDAVLCVFGIFFFPDMRVTLQKMWRILRPNGRLVITTWGPDLFEPAHTAFWNAVGGLRPDLIKSTHSRDRLKTPDLVRTLFEQAGIPVPEIDVEDREHPLRDPADWWDIVMGSSYRGTVDRLTPDEREQIRTACLGVACPSVRIPALYSVATKA